MLLTASLLAGLAVAVEGEVRSVISRARALLLRFVFLTQFSHITLPAVVRDCGSS